MTAVIAAKSVVLGGEKWRVIATRLNNLRQVESYVVERKKKQKTVSISTVERGK